MKNCEFEALENAALRLLEDKGCELLNRELPARTWVTWLINAGAPVNLIIRQFGKSITKEPNRTRHERAGNPTSLGFLLFEFWYLDGLNLPISLHQAWNFGSRIPA